jgi:RNA polymerase sigma-70 factor (ECF subfamily)
MTHPLHTTAQLLHAVRGGTDDPAWALFTERYEPLLMSVARRLGFGAEDAQDLSQQTLLEFVRELRAGRFDRQRGRMRTWILAIARNRARDLGRRQRRRREQGAGVAAAAEEPLDQGSLDLELEAAWEQESSARIAQEAFARLRESQALADRTLLAFELTALRDVPVAEVASQCGMSVDQVYVARSRVAARLRAIMDEVRQAWQEDEPWAS